MVKLRKSFPERAMPPGPFCYGPDFTHQPTATGSFTHGRSRRWDSVRKRFLSIIVRQL